MRPVRPGKGFWLTIAVCFLAALAALIYPVYVIRPFRAQGSRELMAALAVLRFRPPVVILCTIVSVAVFVRYWRRQPRWVYRVLGVVGVLAVGAVAVLSRVNIYELMFHPFDRPSFMPVADVKLEGDEKVIAVKVEGAGRAYPIRVISYHHVINDVVGGVPIAATY